MKNKSFLKAIRQVGSNSDVAKLLGYSESHIRAILCGAKNVPAKAVLKLVELSDGKVTAKELRPDIFSL
jgi:DNA-binding transcriptional regulator YdaS (Cro superfamily)